MKRVMALIIVVAFITLGVFHTADAANPDDAKTMVEKAYAYLEENGKTEAFSEISNPQGQFVKSNLYVFVVDFNGVNLADGGNPNFVGAKHIGFKDTNGKYFIKEMIETAKNKGDGWVQYTWLNPDTKKIQEKITYVKRIKGMDAFIGSGVLK
jgi:cytochrome c